MIKRSVCGFTLLEMLLAVVIFSMVSFIIYSSLKITIKSNNVMGNKVQGLIRLHRVISLLERDVSHSVMHTGSQNDYFSNEGRIIGVGVLDSDSFGIYILRNNKINTEIFIHYQQERLGYRLKANCLERLSYLTLKNTNKMKAQSYCIIEGINDFRVRVFHQGQWLNEWNRIDRSPQGIEITLDVKGVGVIRRVILLLN
ncbi:type II secretion system minor pseudopilin GspJ [Yersinia similis]|uniref:type II secretion system minor pseudopilin GspJ n=1 Tax=Yersinia similis TaxID=367190 RepID=UPI00384C46AF